MSEPQLKKVNFHTLSKSDLKLIFKLLHEHALLDPSVKSNKAIANKAGISEAYYSRTLNPEHNGYSEATLANIVSKLTNALHQEIWRRGADFELIEVEKDSISTAKADNLLHYLYYHVSDQSTAEFSIRKAYLSLDIANKKAKITNYRFSAQTNSSGEEFAKGIPYGGYEGRIELGSSTISLYLNNKFSQISDPEQVAALTVINANVSTLLSGKEYAVCTYNSYHPACGVAVIQSINPEQLDAHFQSNTVPNSVACLLLNRRFTPARYQEGLLDIERTIALTSKVKPFEGAYLGFILKESDSGEAISQIKFHIYDGFKIAFFATTRGNEVKGYIVQFDGRQMTCRLNYNRRGGHFDIAIQLEFQDANDKAALPEKSLAGVFSLIGHNSKRPAAGRIILIPSKKPYDSLKSRHIGFNHQEHFPELIEEHPYLLPFFAGKFDWYIDTPLKHKNPVVLESVQEKPNTKPVNPELQNFGGLYSTFRLSTSKDTVYQRPTEIFPNTGDVVRRLQLSNTRGDVTLFGTANILKNRSLSISLDQYHKKYPSKEEKNEFESRHTIVSFKGRLDKISQDFDGLTTRLSGEDEPVTFREFFFLEAKKTTHQDLIDDWDKDKLPANPEHAKLVKDMLTTPEKYLMKGFVMERSK